MFTLRASPHSGSNLQKNFKSFAWILGFLTCLTYAEFSFAIGNLSVRQEAFISPSVRDGIDKNPGFFSGKYLSDRNAKGESVDVLSARLDAQISPNNSFLSFVNIQELYWQQGALIVGRRLMNWSEIDSSFNLGFYQPLFDWNLTRPRPQGLSGLFVQIHQEAPVPWGINLFASKLFLANQGANYEVRAGKFENSNPYFKGPATTIEFAGQRDPLQYTLEKPEVSEVIFQNSFVSQIFVGQEDEGFYAQAAFAEKPSNKLALGIDGENQSALVWNGRVRPSVYMHRLISADLKYSFSKIQLGASGLREIPREANYAPEWTYFKYQNSSLAGFFVQSLNFSSWKLRFDYLRALGGQESSTGGKLSPYVTELNGSRVPFESALQVSAELFFKFSRWQNLKLNSSLLQEEKGLFASWTSGAEYQFDRFWSIFADLQLLAASEALSTKNIYFANRTNDSASVGVSYVF